jgi:beta-phosphoglucomutase-like phosphatase (HAD superfamily)
MGVIAVDFDHTLVDGDQPRPYAREAMNILREAGHKILIHSCNNVEWIEKVLRNNEIRYDYIYGQDDLRSGKPLCDLYIDDKGYHYKGDWQAELPEIVARLEGKDNRKW